MSDPSCVRGYLHLGLVVDEPARCECLHEVEIDVVFPLEATELVLPEEALLELELVCEDVVFGSNLWYR